MWLTLREQSVILGLRYRTSAGELIIMTEEYMTGSELLAQFNLPTREAKLEQAVKALMEQLEQLHLEHENQSLADNIDNQEVFCSCADAYRMAHTALHS
jgi:hypothetical protein